MNLSDFGKLLRIEKVKEHIKKHKVAYSCGATAVVSAGITWIIVRSNAAQWGAGEGSAQWGGTNTASLIFSNKQMINVTTVLDREGPGHPGWPCRNLETGHIEFSIRAMANYFDIPEGLIAGNIKGKFLDANGLHFERVNLVPQGV